MQKHIAKELKLSQKEEKEVSIKEDSRKLTAISERNFSDINSHRTIKERERLPKS